MATVDLDVLKEIPGYKAILKAVLKSQIQQLIEQLAAHADEESVILTASVADGTLSHMGSNSGKGFLSDHEDVKSQFLGFCLKQHHVQQQEAERKRQEELRSQLAKPVPVPTQLYFAAGDHNHRHVLPKPTDTYHQKAGSNKTRHEPYPNVRPQRNLTGSVPITSTKLEPSETSNDGFSELDNVSEPKGDENSSSSTIPNEASESNAGAKETNSEQGELDPDVNIKVEAISEAEMELEITGVEPGRPMTSQEWDPNVSMGTNIDQGATNQHHGYGPVSDSDLSLRSQTTTCILCKRTFANRANLERHMILHSGSRPFSCEICGKSFTQKAHMKSHKIVHMKDKIQNLI